ncbi:MAG: hypothetical protein HY909_09980 [Deltaproteobacteria bacterium]|nr:hypothetical protein [Deltaproteobacteria bacterium]
MTPCPGGEVSPLRYLRQLSLDLRGAPPTPSEYREVASLGAVPDAMINAFLQDPRFLERVKRWHGDLLWPNLGGFELRIGANLVVVPPLHQPLSVDNINPERLLAIMDRRSDEPVCPPPGDPANLTAASCCTASNPEHPACCLVRNSTYNPDDPACQAKSRALPATFGYGVAVGDQQLRGGVGYLGCDSALEYPPPRVAPDEARWPHDTSGRPWYTSPRTARRRYYYDAMDVPLPYDDARHCPNYCRRLEGRGSGGSPLRTDFLPKVRTVNGVRVEGDEPGAACPEGFTEVANPCDNAVEARLATHVELRREGARLTRPFWARGHWVNTCAYEAQERAVSAQRGAPCNLGLYVESSCGCGPSGAWCAPFTGDNAHPSRTVSRLRDALNREPLELVASVVARDEDYASAFTTRRALANGALAYMYRHQAERVGELEFGASAPPEALPDVPYDDPRWHAYERAPEHSGVLTTPVFLARFATRRARINRFRNAFLCQSFLPPEDPGPPPTDRCHRETNLARRCGCAYCHATLEPLGAAWGRWAERGARFLDPAGFPSFDPRCATCTAVSCPSRCRQYVLAAEAALAGAPAGTLWSYVDRVQDETCLIDDGPRSLVRAALEDGTLQACTARTTWARLLNRPMSPDEERAVLPPLLRDFEARGRSFRALVRAIVTSPAYRRVD